MPKSRHRRKNRTRERKRSSRERSSAEPAAAPVGAQNGHVKSAGKESLLHALLADDGDSLRTVLSYAPLFVGTWVAAGGLLIPVMPPFIILSAIVVITHYLALLYRRPDVPFARELKLVITAASVALVFGYYAFTKSYLLTAIAGVALVTLLPQTRTSRETPRQILIESLVLLCRMGALSLLGLGTQLGQIIPQHAVFGLAPGSILAASLVASKAAHFERSGWKRNIERTKKDGAAQLRPGSLSRLYVLLLMPMPLLPVALSPLGYFQAPFLALALLVYPMPNLAEDFVHRRRSDSHLALLTVKLAAGSTLLLLVIGFLL